MNHFSQGHSYKKTALWVVPWVVLVFLGLWLRIGTLDTRTVHADEAVQGMIFADLLESGEYAYNPRKFHGPSLYYLSLPTAWLRGQFERSSLEIRTLRLVPLIFSLVIALSPIIFRRELGRLGTLVACGFLLLSPGLVYYSTFYIQETLLIAGFSLFSGFYWRYRTSPGMGWAIGMGLAAGLMVASKESGLLYIAVALASGWVVTRKQRSGGSDVPHYSLKDGLITVFAAGLVAIPFFSSFGTNIHGLLDAVTGLYQYEPEPGHDKPWYYYLSLLSGSERGQVFLRSEGSIVLGALVGCVSIWKTGLSSKFASYQLILGILLLACFSIFSYKTPWLVLGLLVPMSVLSGMGMEWIFTRIRNTGWSLVLVVLLLGAMGLSLRESYWTSRAFPVEKRNPYAYVHTSWDLEELTSRVIELSSGTPHEVIKVISDEYWPIPWYLRTVDRVGYWSEVPEDPYAPIMVVSADLAGELDPERMKAYNYEFRGLRPGKIMLLYYLD